MLNNARTRKTRGPLYQVPSLSFSSLRMKKLLLDRIRNRIPERFASEIFDAAGIDVIFLIDRRPDRMIDNYITDNFIQWIVR